MEVFFLVFLGFLAILAVILAVGAAYVTRHEAREREEFQNEARRRASDRGNSDGREFYKSLGLGTGEQVKIRLFTLEEYRGELGGDASHAEDGSFIGALKTYRLLDGDWHETQPQSAASALSLDENDYLPDGERNALLLKKLPPGIPPAARDRFDS